MGSIENYDMGLKLINPKEQCFWYRIDRGAIATIAMRALVVEGRSRPKKL